MSSLEVSARKPGSMKDSEYQMLTRLLEQYHPTHTLEIGMANGGSTVIFCRHVKKQKAHIHVAIDPFQSAEDGWGGQGLECVRNEELEDYLEFIEDFDYLALPRLVNAERCFDFILIDGYHSFDYTILDLFYADKLLRPGGIVVIHDTGWPAVHKAVRFLETHKPYDRLSPPPMVYSRCLSGRLSSLWRYLFGGRKARADRRLRKTQWFSLASFKKREDHTVPDNFYAPF